MLYLHKLNDKENDNIMYIVRQSKHIESDLVRNWSSWNYGEEGLNCTEDELEAAVEEILEDESKSLFISGFELGGDNLRRVWENDEIRELYPNYWVLYDTETSGLCCNYLESDNLLKAIKEVNDEEFDLDMETKDSIDCSDAKVVWSCPDNFWHILYIDDNTDAVKFCTRANKAA